MAEMISVDKEVYEELTEQVRWLNCLEAAGVDNWEGCEFAADLFHEGDNGLG